jgi:hypothetical protein
MKALTWHAKHDVRCESVPDPKIKHARDAIIKVSSFAICGPFQGAGSVSLGQFSDRLHGRALLQQQIRRHHRDLGLWPRRSDGFAARLISGQISTRTFAARRTAESRWS